MCQNDIFYRTTQKVTFQCKIKKCLWLYDLTDFNAK